MPLVTQQAGNPKVQAGKPGYFEAAAFVPMLEKPTRLDRAEGDVHPLGNPHIQTDPRNIARIAGPLSAKLWVEISPSGRATRLVPVELKDGALLPLFEKTMSRPVFSSRKQPVP